MLSSGRNVKHDILEAGVRLLYSQGIASLTQPRIAREAGVRQSHLTYYFPTRNVMILAIADYSIEKLLSETPPPDEASGTVDRMVDHILNSPQVRVMQGLLVAADAEPELRISLAEFIARSRERIRLVLQRHNLPCSDMYVLIFHASLMGLSTMNLARQSAESEAELRAGLGAMFRLFADMQVRGIAL